MTTRMQFPSLAKINSLFWITSLRANEVGVTRRVLDDLEPLCESQHLPFEQFTPTTAPELLAALDAIAVQACHGMLPIIHFDTHGSSDDGIHIVQSGENVGWAAIAEKLRIINRITGNNLCVVSGACFSFQVVSELDINNTSPFFILLAPEQEIAAGDIEANIVSFYRDVLDREDVVTAYERWFPGVLRLFHCEKMLAIVLAKYINNFGLGPQRQRRKEELVTRAFNDGVPRSRQNLRRLRKSADNLIKVNEALIQRFIPTFLAGKAPEFTVKQIRDMVIAARANGVKPEGPYAQ
ncbi:hypothetical protein [Novosphingobium sp. PASSN1]|uniref:hypothetical protein n=1 Tax=Novosphingobium sp. PASSN1 TaxID=2015561 RepID=UPI000BD14FDF|nr:hypothetical protein [Novosphingobium sp. PASSN1]OYU33741.1 MAG: hypothetical protein CFE35_18355 [Novosphingobium sp. PASSN1]